MPPPGTAGRQQHLLKLWSLAPLPPAPSGRASHGAVDSPERAGGWGGSGRLPRADPERRGTLAGWGPLGAAPGQPTPSPAGAASLCWGRTPPPGAEFPPARSVASCSPPWVCGCGGAEPAEVAWSVSDTALPCPGLRARREGCTQCLSEVLGTQDGAGCWLVTDSPELSRGVPVPSLARGSVQAAQPARRGPGAPRG